MSSARFVILFAACALAVAGASPAAAGSRKEDAKAEFDKAETHYKLGRFQEALDAYVRAYEIFPAPALLFDIGQCHKNLKHYDRALFFFEGYLRDETNPARRRLAQQLIATSRAELENQRAAAARAPGAPPAPPLAVPETPPSTPVPAPASAPGALAVVEPLPARTVPAPSLIAAPPPAEQPAREPATHRWWFWTAIGAGVLAATAGAVVYYQSGPTTTVLPAGSVGTLDRR